MAVKEIALNKISPTRALYIKLGHGGEWEKECLLQTQTLRLGFIEADHQSCLRGEWDKVTEQLHYIQDAGARIRAVNQIREFYEAGEDVLWVTFYANKLWWCSSKPKIDQLPDGTKTRPVIGKWKNSDISENTLSMDKLSGRLLSMQGYRGTICSVREFDYLVNKINGILSPRVKEAEDAYSNLIVKLEPLIRDLHWRDFETLIDLIFHQAGWQRMGKVGGAQKTLDLDLFSPITNERYAVQIKSQADQTTFDEYRRRFEDLKGDYDRFYFIVHSPHDNLFQTEEQDDFKLILPKDIARLAVKYGLAEWIISKAA